MGLLVPGEVRYVTDELMWHPSSYCIDHPASEFMQTDALPSSPGSLGCRET